MAKEENTYIESIPEEYREVASIRDAGSMDNLLKQHVNLESKLGNSISFPSDDADDDQLNEFYTKVQERAAGLTRIPSDDDEKGQAAFYEKLGRPKEASEYKFPEIKYGDDKTLDQSGYGDSFREEAHKLGLTGKQFEGIMSYFGEQSINNMETSNEEYDTAMAALKAEWGDSTDQRVSRIQGLVKELGGDEAVAALGKIGENDSKRAGSDPALLKMLDKIAESMGEEGSMDNQGPSGDAATRSQIEDDIATLKNNKAYMDSKDPDHERTVKRVNDLYEKLEKYKTAA